MTTTTETTDPFDLARQAAEALRAHLMGVMGKLHAVRPLLEAGEG